MRHTILVAGAGGYIGVPLCKALVARNHSVCAFDRFFFGIEKLDNVSVTKCIGDTRFIEPTLVEQCDVVVDLAGLSNDATSEIDPELTNDINVRGGMNLAKIAEKAGVKRYIYSSSASVYGHGTHLNMTEADPTNPLTLYALSKVKVETYLRTRQLNACILRNATVYGIAPRMRFDLAVNIMTLRAWRDKLIYVMGGGEQWRPFVHIDDLVEAFVMAIENSFCGTYNVVGENMKIGKLAECVRTDTLISTQSPEIHHIPDGPDKRNYHVDGRRYKEMGWVAKCGIKTGISQLAHALERGEVAETPDTNTLGWYKSLIEWDGPLAAVKVNGRLF